MIFYIVNRLFDDVGEKIKKIAIGIFTVNTILILIATFITVIVSFAVILYGEPYGLLSLFIAPIGAIIEIAAFLLPMQILYGFGELISNSTKLANPEKECKQETFTTGEIPNIHPSHSAGAKTNAQQEDNWICQKCGHENLAQFATCFQCNAAKDEHLIEQLTALLSKKS